MDDPHEKSPLDSIDRMQKGLQTVILVTHTKTAAIKHNVSRGEWKEASEEAMSLGQLLAEVHRADRMLGYLGKGRIVALRDIEEGMEIADVGTVTSIGDKECEACGKMHRIVELSDGSTFDVDAPLEFVVIDKDED